MSLDLIAQINAMAVVPRRTDDLLPYARNSRVHSAKQIDMIVRSITEFGFTNPVLTDGKDGIVAGHGRVMAARQLGLDEVPTIDLGHLSEEQKRAYVIADNQIALKSDWDNDMLAMELGDLNDAGLDLLTVGFDEFDLAKLLGDDFPGKNDTLPGEEPAAGADKAEGEAEEKAEGAEGSSPSEAGSSGASGPSEGGAGSLAARFGVVPFTVLNAREGWWQNRKRAWLALGISSEVGRGENLLRMSDTMLEPDPEKRAAKFGDQGMAFSGGPMPEGTAMAGSTGTSIFDPVLCELAYRWFCPKGGVILDPFSGGSVRGIVAAKLGREYIGVDLRPEQIEANQAQARQICGEGTAPAWVCGDSRKVIPRLDVEADFVWSCPPYGDLEVYSDREDDLSNMDHAEFIEGYRAIIAAAVAKLKPNRFAAWVIGDFRDNKGNYRNFVSDTIAAFQDAGAMLYNEAILVTAVGSLALRAGGSFKASRKLGKTHQNVLVFIKGDAKRATEALGEVEFGEIEEAEAQAEAAPVAPLPTPGSASGLVFGAPTGDALASIGGEV